MAPPVTRRKIVTVDLDRLEALRERAARLPGSVDPTAAVLALLLLDLLDLLVDEPST